MYLGPTVGAADTSASPFATSYKLEDLNHGFQGAQEIVQRKKDVWFDGLRYHSTIDDSDWHPPAICERSSASKQLHTWKARLYL
jgi:hypothetical protein